MVKPHHGRIKDWEVMRTPNGFKIHGEFLDHPGFRGHVYTSTVLKYDQETGEIETRNSRYKLVFEGEPSRFQDFPMKGDKMIFLGENGYPHQLAEAFGSFSVGQVLDVEACDVGPWDHTVKFARYPGSWNGVMFKRIKEEVE